MRSEIGDYALLGDTRTAALVSRADRSTGCACHGSTHPPASRPSWAAASTGAGCWRPLHRTGGGQATLSRGHAGPGDRIRGPRGRGHRCRCDAPIADGHSVSIVREVIGRGGRVPMRMELAPRFGYGRYSPVLARAGGDLLAVCGPDTLRLSGPVDVESQRARRARRSRSLADNGSRSCSPGSPRASLLPRTPSLRLWSAAVSAGGGPGPRGVPTTANGARQSSGRC